MRLTLEQVARATGGRVTPPGANPELLGISTDSRTISTGELFVPLRGERFDGHDFLPLALRNGAAASLSEEVIAGLSVPVVHVSDTLKALGDIAMLCRRRLSGPVVAITGSTGKTTTKEMLASIMDLTGPGLKTDGNFNNLIGLPLTLFGLDPRHQWAVLELGMSARGEMARLAEIAGPTIGVITNVGPAHLDALHGVDGVARAKGELFVALRPGGTAVFNADDERVRQLPVANGVRLLGFGLSPLAEVRGENVRSCGGSMTFDLVLPSGRFPVILQVPGEFHVYDALAAAAAAYVVGVGGEIIAKGLKTFEAVGGRMKVVNLPGDLQLIEDHYNANPLSMRAALKAFSEMAGEGRRIVVLGDMLELGEQSRNLHQDIGRFAGPCCDLLVTFGPAATDLAQAAKDEGFAADCLFSGLEVDEVVNWLTERLQAGDRLLLKGSRGMRMERISDAVKTAWNQALADQN